MWCFVAFSWFLFLIDLILGVLWFVVLLGRLLMFLWVTLSDCW